MFELKLVIYWVATTCYVLFSTLHKYHVISSYKDPNVVSIIIWGNWSLKWTLQQFNATHFFNLLQCVVFYHTLISVPKRVHKRLHNPSHKQKKANTTWAHLYLNMFGLRKPRIDKGNSLDNPLNLAGHTTAYETKATVTGFCMWTYPPGLSYRL